MRVRVPARVRKRRMSSRPEARSSRGAPSAPAVFVFASRKSDRSPTAKMLSSSCVTMTIVVPSDSRIFSVRSSSSFDAIGSSPAPGSSKNRISGSSAMARAIEARFAMPPEISEGYFSAAAERPTSASLQRATSSRSRAFSVVYSSSGSDTFSSSVIDDHSAPP